MLLIDCAYLFVHGCATRGVGGGGGWVGGQRRDKTFLEKNKEEEIGNCVFIHVKLRIIQPLCPLK